jgi:hypothetical protein
MSSDFGRVGNDGMDGRWTVWRSRKIGDEAHYANCADEEARDSSAGRGE